MAFALFCLTANERLLYGIFFRTAGVITCLFVVETASLLEAFLDFVPRVTRLLPYIWLVRFCAIAKCTSDLTNSAFILYSLVSVLVVCFAFEVFTTQTVKIVKGCLLCELSVFDWYGMTFLNHAPIWQALQCKIGNFQRKF